MYQFLTKLIQAFYFLENLNIICSPLDIHIAYMYCEIRSALSDES